MRENWKYLAFTAVILILSFSLTVGTLVFGPSKAAANEQLNKAPVLVDRAGNWNPDVLSDTALWFSDHFFLRQELISLHNWLSAKLLRTSGSESVILGRSGWLYYADTVADYTSTEADRLLAQRAANNLALMAQYCRENGKAFLFTIAPNKNSLYPAYMPEGITPGGERTAELLHAALDARSVPYADLFSAFGKEEAVLYFAHDSHWNAKGAALGADVINKAFGVESTYFQNAFETEADHTGDLYNMLYPAFSDREQNPVYSGKLEFTYTGNGKKPDSILLETAGKGSGSLLAYRDSFGNLLYPYLAESYEAATFSRATVYDLTVDADYVLIELVERNLEYLVQYVPVMPSPVTDIPQTNGAESETAVYPNNNHTPEGCVQLRGRLAQSAAEQVLVMCGGVAYRAFLLEDGGFAVQVPADAEAEAVYYYSDSQWKQLTVEKKGE